MGNLGLVERVLPVTESHPTRSYCTLHLLFSRSGFSDDVQRWSGLNNVRLLTPATLLVGFDA